MNKDNRHSKTDKAHTKNQKVVHSQKTIAIIIIFIGLFGLMFAGIAYFNSINKYERIIDEAKEQVFGGAIIGGFFLIFGCCFLFDLLKINNGQLDSQIDNSLPINAISNTQQLEPLNPPIRIGIKLTLICLLIAAILSIFLSISTVAQFFAPLIIIAFMAGSTESLLDEVILTAHNAPAKLGKRIKIEWSTSGGLISYSQLSLTLVAVERSVHHIGTDAQLEEREFFRKELPISDIELKKGGGTVDIDLPVTGMHSWTSTNNAIIWRVHLIGKGQLANREDYFILNVLPSKKIKALQ